MTVTDDSLADVQFVPDAPPLAPDEPALTNEQLRFMWLHARHVVVRWRWQFQGAQLRAFTERGFTATISENALASLVERGLMLRGVGCADVLLTDAGLEAAK